MPSYSVVILICALNVGQPDCQPDTAVDVMRGPRVANPMMCNMAAQSMVGQTELAPREGLEYMKIMCVPAGQPVRAAARMVADQ